MADEEGMSDRIAASADGLGVCSFPYVINRIFLVGERVGHPQDHLGSQMNKIKGKVRHKTRIVSGVSDDIPFHQKLDYLQE
jgi:hypothetical protein